MDNRSIKHNIYKLRRDKGMSQEEVANLMDISLTSYRKIEKGETNLISERISQLAGALGITEQELLWGYNPNSSQQQMQAEIQRLRQALEEKTEQIELLKKALLDKEEIIRLYRTLCCPSGNQL
jgi:transcriptional regulator with XRE-family HTH domain